MVDTMLLVGEKSPVFLRDSVKLLADALPRARVEPLPGQGHLAPTDAPAVVGKALRHFLSP